MDVKSEVVEIVCFLASIGESHNNIAVAVKRSTGETVFPSTVQDIIHEHPGIMDLYRSKGIESVNMAIKQNILKHVSLYDRVRTLDQIVQDTAIEGYTEEMVNSRGEVITTTKKNYGAAISALGMLNEVLGNLGANEDLVEFVVTETSPNKEVIERMSLASEVLANIGDEELAEELLISQLGGDVDE